jgi:hypothetical protein
MSDEMMTETMTEETDTDETTSEGAAAAGETPAAKKARVGGRVRALSQVDALLSEALKVATEKSMDTAALNHFAAAFEKLRNPPPKQQRNGSVRVAKLYYVGWKTDGTRIAFTQVPTGVKFEQENGKDRIRGPFASRETALLLVDLGYIPQVPAPLPVVA